jgi:hypothetical protein
MVVCKQHVFMSRYAIGATRASEKVDISSARMIKHEIIRGRKTRRRKQSAAFLFKRLIILIFSLVLLMIIGELTAPDSCQSDDDCAYCSGKCSQLSGQCYVDFSENPDSGSTELSDSCQYANDGECDEPESCAIDTDTNESSSFPLPPPSSLCSDYTLKDDIWEDRCGDLCTAYWDNLGFCASASDYANGASASDSANTHTVNTPGKSPLALHKRTHHVTHSLSPPFSCVST